VYILLSDKHCCYYYFIKEVTNQLKTSGLYQSEIQLSSHFNNRLKYWWLAHLLLLSAYLDHRLGARWIRACRNPGKTIAPSAQNLIQDYMQEVGEHSKRGGLNKSAQ